MSSDQEPDREEDVRRTTDPALIRSIVEDRGGYPAHEPQTEGEGDRGLLRIGQHGRDEDLKEITWEEFTSEFESKGLEFVYPDEEDDTDEIGTLRERSD